MQSFVQPRPTAWVFCKVKHHSGNAQSLVHTVVLNCAFEHFPIARAFPPYGDCVHSCPQLCIRAFSHHEHVHRMANVYTVVLNCAFERVPIARAFPPSGDCVHSCPQLCIRAFSHREACPRLAIVYTVVLNCGFEHFLIASISTVWRLCTQLSSTVHSSIFPSRQHFHRLATVVTTSEFWRIQLQRRELTEFHGQSGDQSNGSTKQKLLPNLNQPLIPCRRWPHRIHRSLAHIICHTAGNGWHPIAL